MIMMIRGSDEYNIKILSTIIVILVLKQLKTEISKRCGFISPFSFSVLLHAVEV